MSKLSKWLESKGWRLWSRTKRGIYIQERWYHPRDASKTFSQESAVRHERMLAKHPAPKDEA